MPEVLEYKQELSKWEHLFTIHTPLISTPVGLVPGGFRVDVTYGADSKVISAKPDSMKDAELNGVLVSGYESILVTSEAVAEFDGRITIKFVKPAPPEPVPLEITTRPAPVTPPGPGAGTKVEKATQILVGARLVGRADLGRAAKGPARVLPEGSDRRTIYEAWKGGFGEGATLPFLLTITLDVASAPIESPDPIDPAYKPYLPLGRMLLVAPGTVTYGPGRYSPPKSVVFHVCKWTWQPEPEA